MTALAWVVERLTDADVLDLAPGGLLTPMTFQPGSTAFPYVELSVSFAITDEMVGEDLGSTKVSIRVLAVDKGDSEGALIPLVQLIHGALHAAPPVERADGYVHGCKRSDALSLPVMEADGVRYCRLGGRYEVIVD